ncbi:MAG: GNAT family N-acetyltransferase [Candidatus Woesearchaeota archaeon]
MNIIQVLPEDWPVYKNGIIAVENSTFEEGVRYTEEEEEFVTFLEVHAINFIILEEDTILGYLMSSRLEDDDRCVDDPHYGKYDTVHLESIAILPTHQSKGLGKQLFKAFLNKAFETYKRVVLDATSDGMIRLAESEGFVKKKFQPHWEGTRDSWFMEKIRE